METTVKMKKESEFLKRGILAKLYPLFYYGETAVGVHIVNWTSQMARDHQWESAVETVRAHEENDLNRLKFMVEEIPSCVTNSELDMVELHYYNEVVTAGLFKKRLRYWRFVLDIFNNSAPAGLNKGLIQKPNRLSPFIMSNRIANATKAIVKKANEMINYGENKMLFYKADYKPGKENEANLCDPRIFNTTELMQIAFYRTLQDWSKQK